VTGATGFIGWHLCEALVGLGAEVHGLSRTAAESLPGGVVPEPVDLQEAQAVREVLARLKPGFIFHLAGLVTGRQERSLVLPMLHHNLVGTVHLLLAALEAGVERLVLTGSSEEVYGGDRDGIPSSPYAASKTAGTLYARMFHRLYGLPVVVVRPFMVYGPRQAESKLVPHIIVSLLSGKPPRLSSGERVYDFVYVQDVVRGLLKAALAPRAAGEEIELGSGVGFHIRDLAELLVGLTGSSIQPLYGAVADRVGEHSRIADLTKARDLLGWEPIWSLREGLAETIAWYRAHLSKEVDAHGKS
jgi:nucleoside-diphosphate-sugar epimerase